MKQLTIRRVSPELAKALEAESRLRKQSINQTVLAVLHQALGLSSTESYDNGLGKLADTWTEDEFREFQDNIALFEQIDPELWQE